MHRSIVRMQRFRSVIKGALGLIAAVTILSACGQTLTNKAKASSKANASKNETLYSKSDEVMLAIFSSRNAYPFPICKEGSYRSSSDIPVLISDEITWRHEAEIIKTQLLQEIFSQGLTRANAVQLALVNNPDLFAYYENLEIGYADLLESGLRRNPAFVRSLGASGEGVQPSETAFDTTINFLDYFLIPFRKQAALAELQVIESEVQHKVLELVKEVEMHWIEVKALELEYDQRKQFAEAKELAAKIAKLQQQAGNISELSARAREIEALDAGENINSTSVQAARERMNRKLGLVGDEVCWKLGEEINWKEDAKILKIPNLELVALDNRPDIESIRREIFALAQKAKLKEPWTYANISVGFSGDLENGISPGSVALEAPIFNYGQAETSKFDSLISQAQERLLDKAIESLSKVREYVTIGKSYTSALEDYENNIIPASQKQIADAQAEYNVMTLGVYELFDLKCSEINEKLQYIFGLREFEKIIIELLYTIGGSIPNVGEMP
jgi:cobalt-zinc-cadmium efflux system outer membrane protein